MRPIDADALRESYGESIEECRKWADEMRKSGNEEMVIRAEQSLGTFVECSLRAKNAPTIDAVTVVRCKDCKWFGDFGCAIKIVDDSDRPTENDFCSFAERKDE